MSYPIAHAAAWDEGNRHMRENGRTVWDESDYNACSKLLNELLDAMPENVLHPSN